MDWIINTYANSDLVKCFFWGPLLFNLIVYPFHLWACVQEDRAKVAEYNARRAKGDTVSSLYSGNFVTVGTLFKHVFLCITPVVNALACFFDAAPIAWGWATCRFGWLLNLKLVSTPEGK